MNIEKLISRIIPPNDYQHREGFSNTHLIDQLNEHEKELVEEELIRRLSDKSDMLIVETLAYMKSLNSLPVLKDLLEKCSNAMGKIIIAASIYSIRKDDKMVAIAIISFKYLDNIYQKISAFYYLRMFRHPETDSLIKEYTNHKEYLLSYNAKRALSQ